MFTGLIETVGTITNLSGGKITISSPFAGELNLGDSVSVNGVCLTVVDKTAVSFSAEMSFETLNVTNFSTKKVGDKVNLERAMLANSRLDGHFVYGHVDTVAKILNIESRGDFAFIRFALDDEYKNLVVKKGSIAIDGISLTIAEVDSTSFSVAIIPHSMACSTLGVFKVNDIVNLEFDILAKYIEKNLAVYHNKSKINLQFLEENGFL